MVALTAATIACCWLLSSIFVLSLANNKVRVEKRLALAGFLAGYSSLTGQAYKRDLRQFAAGVSSTSCRSASSLRHVGI